jgi:hypothetical protein
MVTFILERNEERTTCQVIVSNLVVELARKQTLHLGGWGGGREASAMAAVGSVCLDGSCDIETKIIGQRLILTDKMDKDAF